MKHVITDPRGQPLTDPEMLAQTLERHPQDGWIMAEPWPMGPATIQALRGVITALLPPPPAPWPDDIVPRVERHVRLLLRYMYPLTATGFGLIVHVLDYAPLWRFEALSRLHKLPRERADQVLEGLASSRFMLFRQLMMAVRGAVLSTYFDQDEVQAAIGYQPLPFMYGRIDLRRRLLRGETPRPDDMIGPFSPGLDP